MSNLEINTTTNKWVKRIITITCFVIVFYAGSFYGSISYAKRVCEDAAAITATDKIYSCTEWSRLDASINKLKSHF